MQTLKRPAVACECPEKLAYILHSASGHTV